MKDFFVSYNKHDKAWAEWLAWTLEENGYTVIVEVWDFQPGGNFALYMDRAVREARQTIAVLSKQFLDANYVYPEWAAAFARDPQGLERTLIPVRVSECKPEGLLAQIVYVDLVGVPEAEAHTRLVNGLLERAKPDQKPSFPGAVVPKAERVEPEPVAFPPSRLTILGQIFVQNRRQFFIWLAFGGVGGAVLAAKYQLGGPSPPVLPTPVPTPTLSASTVLRTFKFDVVTVNAKGEPISKKPGQARAFTEDLGNGVTLVMVSIPGGKFLMGSPASEKERVEREGPQHKVTVKPFLIGKYAVTQAHWQAVAALPQVKRQLDPDPSQFKGENRPVEKVSWLEAVEFCARLSRKTGREYRLPTEAEWEYACRAGTTTPFHFGETITTDLANYAGVDGTAGGKSVSGSYGAGPKGIYRQQTTDVGTFPPNAFGLYDLHGNVWEWCLDHWHNNYQGAPTDGSAWIEGGNSEKRVLRGGSSTVNPSHCRSAFRDDAMLDYRYPYIGFRVVCGAP